MKISTKLRVSGLGGTSIAHAMGSLDLQFCRL